MKPSAPDAVLPTSATIIARTPRLILRTWTAADVEPIADVWSDPETMRHAGAVPRERIAQALAAGLAAWRRYGVCLWAVEAEGEGLVGDCGFHPHADGLELAYHLHRRVWGRGYATEAARAVIEYAFDAMPDDSDAIPSDSDAISDDSGAIPDDSGAIRGSQILAWVHPDNPRSARVLDRLGFVCEGPDPAEDGELRYRLAGGPG